MLRFSKTIWNLGTNSNILRDIDKTKLCTKLNKAITTGNYTCLCTMKLYLWRKLFLEEQVFSKNIRNFEINPKTLRCISERKLCRKLHLAVAHTKIVKSKDAVSNFA